MQHQQPRAWAWWGHRGKAGTTLEMASPPASGSRPHWEEHSCGQLDAEVPGDPLVVPGSALWVQGKPSVGPLCKAGPRPAAQGGHRGHAPPREGRVRKRLRGGRRDPGDISCCHPGTEGRSTSWRLSCVSCLPGERAVVRLIPSLRFSALQFF